MKDKTQIAITMLSLKIPKRSLILGSISAFAVIGGIGALAGKGILSLLPAKLTNLICGSLFLVLGIFSLLGKESLLGIGAVKRSFLSVFSLVSLMELGDKTQLASIALVTNSSYSLLNLRWDHGSFFLNYLC